MSKQRSQQIHLGGRERQARRQLQADGRIGPDDLQQGARAARRHPVGGQGQAERAAKNKPEHAGHGQLARGQAKKRQHVDR